MSFWKKIYLMNGLNKNTMKIDWLLDYTFLFLWMITIVVVSILCSIMTNKFINKNYKEFSFIEFMWTVLPGLVVLLIALPSLELLYQIEEKQDQNITLKVTGHQWYWNYDFLNLVNFDSYLESNNIFNSRVLEVDNHLVTPTGKILTAITSEDVLHSWSLPSLGVKMDANPGRLNSTLFFNNTPGIFYGHCSEICGANHSFMPIILESVNFLNFKQWLMNMLN